MNRRAEKVSTGWERCEGVILLNFHTPIIFPFVGLKSDGSVRMLRSLAVDTFSALPSMAKRQFGIVIIKSGMPVFSLKSRFFHVYMTAKYLIFFFLNIFVNFRGAVL
jgi:hypothetical protein